MPATAGSRHAEPAKTRSADESRAAGGPGAEGGCYVYGIVPGDVELTPGASGVGDPPQELQLVRSGRIAALVSDIDVSQPLGRPEDLLAHQQVLDAASAETPVLPVRFGAVMTDSAAVADELLAPHSDEFTAALDELEGHAQYVVKGRYVEEAVLGEVLSENPEAARLAEEIRAVADEDATRDIRIRLGEIIASAVAAKREADTRAFGDVLARYCTASSVREPSHEEDAVNIALLAETTRQADLERAVSEQAREWEGRVTLRLMGPMAPYDFVTTRTAGG
jgi:hypothetical protein